MKIDYQIAAELNQEQIFAIMRESIEKKTGKQLANIYWNESDAGVSCKLIFRDEPAELKE
jgi:hypothetical protein